jgi:Zn-finger nucleic acid-binding protein
MGGLYQNNAEWQVISETSRRHFSLHFSPDFSLLLINMADGSELLCPRCKLPLKDVRSSGGVFYGCDVCGGRAVTIELLRKRFTPESINPLWLHAMRGEGRVGLPCPSCWQPMIGVALSDQAEINVDICKRCHFIWFDAHEVDTLVPRQPESAAAELPQKAREMLAIAEVERLSKQAEGPDLDSAAPEELIALAAFIGDLAHIALDPRSQTPCIGASGGIAGVITFYALNLPQMRLAFLMRWGFVWFRWIRLPAWFVFVLWILFQIIGTLEQKAGMSSVSSAAHLGGAAVGVLAWLVWRKPNDESRMLE